MFEALQIHLVDLFDLVIMSYDVQTLVDFMPM